MIGLGLSITFSLLIDYFTGVVLTLAVVALWRVLDKGRSWKERFETRKKLEKMREIFPQSLGMAVQALKTGQTVPQVLEYLAREAPSPLREELALVCAEMDLGVPPEQALAKMIERYPEFMELQQFLESYRISRQTGANLTHLLEVLVDGMEEKNRILRKMEAMTAQARLSGLMVGALPFVLGIVFFLMDPGLMTPLFTQKAGFAILFLALFLEGIGFAWIRRLLRLEA